MLYAVTFIVGIFCGVGIFIGLTIRLKRKIESALTAAAIEGTV